MHAYYSNLHFLSNHHWQPFFRNTHANFTSAFESIPDSCYFVVITMTTVGYGDKAPVTFAGQLFTVFAAVLGIFFIAFPVSIFSSNFSTEYDKLQRKKNYKDTKRITEKLRAALGFSKTLHTVQGIADHWGNLTNEDEDPAKKMARRLSQQTANARKPSESRNSILQTVKRLSIAELKGGSSKEDMLEEAQKLVESDGLRNKIDEVLLKTRKKMWADVRRIERKHR